MLRTETLKTEIRPKKKSIFVQLPTETQAQSKPLFLVLQKIYFDEIIAGTKNKEYRDYSEFYLSRLLTKDRKKMKRYDSVIFQEGYHKNARRMAVNINKVVLKTRFIIHLDEIIEKNF